MASKLTLVVGSEPWISAEKENVIQLLQQEKEEMIFPAQHEMEWLNEHMAEIFSKSHVNVANIFKTPGKLRGKTPRTVRKGHFPDTRIPLGDVFAARPPNQVSPMRIQNTSRPVPQFVVPHDIPEPRVQKGSSLVDSGYHGSQDEMDADADTQHLTQKSVASDQVETIPQPEARGEGRTTEGSFHSAKEDQTTKMLAMQVEEQSSKVLRRTSVPSKRGSGPKSVTNARHSIINPMNDFNPDFADLGSPSDESTPDRPLVRKSSLTFAALPAREPLKQSIGARISRTSHVEASRTQPLLKANAASLPIPHTASITSDDEDEEEDKVERVTRNGTYDDEDEDDSNIEILGHDDSDEELQSPPIQLPNKSSTQRLHEKIDMLGKTAAPRLSKSIPSAVTFNNAKTAEIANPRSGPADDDEDWIKPLQNMPNPPPELASPAIQEDGNKSEDEDVFDVRAPELIAHEERMKTPVRMSPSPGKSMAGYGYTKAASTVTLASPEKLAAPTSPSKFVSVSNPGMPSTTPQGSPKRYLDGPLSVSKSKIQSIMKTAKGLFTSSAGVSAAAKMETFSPDMLKTATKVMPGMYPNLNNLLENKPLPSNPPSRRTRASIEREEKRNEKEQQLKQKMHDQLEKVREKERQKVADSVLRRNPPTAPSSPIKPTEQQRAQDVNDMPPPALSHIPSTKSARPVRPTRENTLKSKPVPVSIKVGSLSQRMPITGASLSVAAAVQEPATAEPIRPGLNKKTSNASLQSTTSATSSFKTSVNGTTTKPRAVLAAERKREQEEKDAQRKLDQKRELERKRAAQQEEARKQEQKQRAEAEKKERDRIAAEQAKRQAQQQAIERKRQETARKAEQQRVERNGTDAGPPRPVSRLGGANANASASVHRLATQQLPTNPAKPAKRPLDEESTRPQAVKFAAAPQADSKRRKTEDESVVEPPSRPTMSGAPVRQSYLGKKASLFTHSTYSTAPPPTHIPSFPQPPTRVPPSMAQFGNGNRIPFADPPPIPQQNGGNPPSHGKALFASYQQSTIQAVKSSPRLPPHPPQFMNGDAIHLPEIPTDSEDEDSEDEAAGAFPIPDWATPGHLTEQLMRQEGMDGDAVFGPIAQLKLEEIFAKGNKDRLKRLRDRTSSANWATSGDGLTLEEVRIDREQRERMRLDGGWRLGS